METTGGENAECCPTPITSNSNFSEEFIFEPALEPGVPPSVLAELEAANVQFIHVFVGLGDTRIRIVGLDGKFRTVD
jgi:hypothetical protein